MGIFNCTSRSIPHLQRVRVSGCCGPLICNVSELLDVRVFVCVCGRGARAGGGPLALGRYGAEEVLEMQYFLQSKYQVQVMKR